DKAHGHDWDVVSGFLPVWMKHLAARKDLNCGCYLPPKDHWSKWQPDHQFVRSNRYVVCLEKLTYRVDGKSLNEIEQVIEQLAQRVGRCFDLVEELRELS
ncbi:MAG: hypothetical protein AB1705_04315, partial [Verrucomicrobiota bacterium]